MPTFVLMNLWFATVDITCWQLGRTKLKDAMCKNLPAFQMCIPNE